MAKRHVILLEKIAGDKAVLSPSTMEELGLSDGDSLTIAAHTNLVVLPVIAGTLVGANQIKLPRKVALMMKEGERLMVQPSPLGTPETVLPEPQKAPSAPQQSEDASSIEWDEIPSTTLDEVVGLGPVKARIEQSLFYLTHPEWFLLRKSLPPRVFLFFGPYGSGKTMLARAMVSKLAHTKGKETGLDVKMKAIRPTDVKDAYLGMSAKNVQHFLSAAREECNKGSTVLLLLDEIDSLVANRADGQTHEEYRDVVNSLIQEIQGVQDLATESRIKALWQDPEVVSVRNEIAALVRKKGKRDHGGDIQLAEKDWSPEIKQRMQHLRRRITEAGGVSTVIIVGTTNDPGRVDEAFISRAGDNVFFVPRPSAEAIDTMLDHQLDSDFFELDRHERKTLAQRAFQFGLTGRDIMLSWLQPLRNKAPGLLTIMGFKTIESYQPQPTVGIEWEMDLYRRLKSKGHMSLAEQVGDYLREMEEAQKKPSETPPPSSRNGKAPRKAAKAREDKQPALLDM
jgi:SpoVK/Ycf46/Vps4 family AAA+-type ATPase